MSEAINGIKKYKIAKNIAPKTIRQPQEHMRSKTKRQPLKKFGIFIDSGQNKLIKTIIKTKHIPIKKLSIPNIREYSLTLFNVVVNQLNLHIFLTNRSSCKITILSDKAARIHVSTIEYVSN